MEGKCDEQPFVPQKEERKKITIGSTFTETLQHIFGYFHTGLAEKEGKEGEEKRLLWVIQLLLST